MKPIYLDHHSTTPLDPLVLEAMMPFLKENFGNPSSEDHPYGWIAAEAVETARKEVATLIGAKPREIIFTGGATESSNLAWQGLHRANPSQKHFITSAIEHSSILEIAKHLSAQGAHISILAVDRAGRISLDQLAKEIGSDTLLVSIQFANNEIGTVQDIAAIGKLCKSANVYFHVDATQAAALMPIDVEAMHIDLLSLSAHKIYGPKGVGALYIRSQNSKVNLQPLTFGGGQENGLRPGTLNVPAIVGFGCASRLAHSKRNEDSQRILGLRDWLWAEISRALPGAQFNGASDARLANNLHLTFSETEAELLIQNLKNIAISTGAACGSGRREPSHVLKAMGLSDSEIHSSIRLGLGRFTTEAEIRFAAQNIIEAVRGLKEKNAWAKTSLGEIL